MIRLLSRKRHGPLGVDIGSRSVKLLQLSSDRRRVIDVVRWDLPGQDDSQLSDDDRAGRIVEALRLAQEGRGFRRRDADGSEEEGWLVSFVYRALERETEAVILDARRVSDGPVATLKLRENTGVSFHGDWVGAER